MYNLAVLYDKTQFFKPSNPEFIEYFVHIARKNRILCTVIGKQDLPILQQFDGLFIRDTTQRDHYTLEFAETAERLAMPVLDDSKSIWRCTSKLIQQQIFSEAKIPYPISKIISNVDRHGLGYPCIIKTPDSAFSQGVYKIDNRHMYNKIVIPLFHKYPRLLMQEYIRTAFDWRICVLDDRPLFAIKYYMLPNDYRIVGTKEECDHETVSLAHVPKELIQLALRACACIGNGLYGVDIKVRKNEMYVIEVNDNPNIERGVEDQCEGDTIYHAICQWFTNKFC